MTIALREQGTGASTVLGSSGLKPTSKSKQAAWLCLRFAHLSLNTVGVRYADQSNTIITQDYQVWQLNQNAEDYGVCEGQSVGHALMLNPGVQLVERQCEDEALKLKQLSEWAYRFTSHVCVYDDHTLLLEIGRSLSLFRGLKHLHHLIEVELERLNMDVCSAVAATPKAAYVLSNGYQQGWVLDGWQELLKHAYLQDLSLQPKTIAQLQHCGFTTVGDIVSIPADEMGERFGQDALVYLNQLLGQTPDPQIFTTPPETFSANVDFAEPIRNRLWIEQQVTRLLQDLLSFVQDRQLLCRGFTWHFYHENNRLLKTIEINVNSIRMDLKMIQELTNLKFASTAMDWEFSRIELTSEELFAKSLWHNDLFDPRPDQENFDRLIGRLNSRLGTGAVRELKAQPEHLPELANQSGLVTNSLAPSIPHKEQEKAGGEQSNNSGRQTSELMDEPLWLLEHPRRLSKLADGMPLCEGPLTFIHGPNRVSSHWWSQLRSRDYYIARQTSGRLLWVYFERTQQQWYMHGAFA